MATTPTAGSTQTFILDAVLDDGSPWDLSAATVTLFIRRPDNKTIDEVPATVTDAAGGVAEANYTFGPSGNYLRVWLVEEGDVVQYTRARVERVGPGKLVPRPKLGVISA